MNNAKEIDVLALEKQIKKYSKDRTNTVVRHALNLQTMDAIARNQDSIRDIDFNFSVNINTLEVANQKRSGRCWIFAATNVLREIIAKKLNLKSFELSQSYIAFYDKLEKYNFELEAIISLLGVEHDDRTLVHVLNNSIGDGGQWDMFVNVVKKYGIVPKNVFPETATSSNTGVMTRLVDTELRKFAGWANNSFKKGTKIEEIREVKENLLSRITDLMVSCYGIPPVKFDFEYTDKDNKYHLVKGFTPKSFFDKYIGEEIDEYVSIINAPTVDKPFNKSYTISYLGNVVGGKLVKHLNLPMDRMIELIVSQLKDNRIVWFGSDVSYYGDRTGGEWNDKAYDYKSIFNLDFSTEKDLGLDYGISQMNHAMCITGVNLKNGVPTKWKIENSWGSENGHKGYYIMSDTWFNKYTYQAVVRKEYLTAEELKAYEAEPVVLKPWDPMGSLAD